ncbi:MAG TPA: S8 family peptidase [Actinomycetota bacterium]|nr:S8 family peptidase [Actinomycetota bacterium]
MTAAVLVALMVLVGMISPLRAPSPSGPAKTDPALQQMAAEHPHTLLPVIVRVASPSPDGAERLVERLGGRVTHELPIIGGFSAQVPGSAIPALAKSKDVATIWSDGRVHMASQQGPPGRGAPTDVQNTVNMRHALELSTGAGVTVALLDTGVSQVSDLGDRVLARIDFTPDHNGYDTYGHGTHMAGIIAGDGTASSGAWAGAAPDANLVSVKVAGADGSTDVSIVIAGMQWIVSHRAQYNIRVLNLSFGTDATQSYVIDPLDYAVERVWQSGILVVVAAGNRGPAVGTVNKPGDDPFVVTVGAADLHNNHNKNDDAVAAFSSVGPTQDGLAKPYLVAPGIRIVSDRAAGSTIDQLYPKARIGDSYFKGTGTSQAAAILSGIAALMFQANPRLTPDVAKAALLGTTNRDLVGQPGAGDGLVDAYAAVRAAASGAFLARPANVGLRAGTGLGSLEASRGSNHVYADLNGDGVLELVTGEIDVLGNSWSGNSWSGNSWSGNSWSGYVYEAPRWAMVEWSGNSWSGTSWSGNSWSGNSWSGDSWSGNSWE